VFATTLAAALQEFDTEREQPEVAGVDRSRICAKHPDGNSALGIEVVSAPVVSLQANPNCERVIVSICEHPRWNDFVILGSPCRANVKSRVWQ
jgi:hypothetical protein